MSCAGCLLVTLLGCLSLPAAQPAPSPSGRGPELLQRVRQKYNFPGLAVLVLKGGQIRELAAVGVRKLGDPTPLTTNDVFHIGSCTKSMTATLAALLVQEGKLRWETTVAEVFPELRDTMHQDYKHVTLAQLLTHRAGVPANPPPAAWDQAWRQQGNPRQQRYEFIKSVLREKPAAPPGSRYLYSNQGYAIAGAMLEKLTGVAWEQLITQRLFKPLHMDSAGFGPPGTKGKVDQPWGHHQTGATVVPVQQDNPPAIGPAGRVHCSLPDLAKYLRLHLQDHSSPGLLTPESLHRLHTPPPGADYAFGWGCVQRSWAGGTALTHTGSNTMWFLVMWLAPARDFAVIVATNTGAGDTFKGCDEVAGAMIQQWLAPGA